MWTLSETRTPLTGIHNQGIQSSAKGRIANIIGAIERCLTSDQSVYIPPDHTSLVGGDSSYCTRKFKEVVIYTYEKKQKWKGKGVSGRLY